MHLMLITSTHSTKILKQYSLPRSFRKCMTTATPLTHHRLRLCEWLLHRLSRNYGQLISGMWKHLEITYWLVSWCLTSLFSTNIRLYQGRKVRVESYPYPV